MASHTLDGIELEPPMPARASVIWMHGLGADGSDFAGLVPELGLQERGVRFILPHAPFRPVTVNGGYVMRAWYDVLGVSFVDGEDRDGLEDSREAVDRLIERERQRGVPASRVVLAGFSQGGALALHAGLRYPEGLAGILALSAYLPLAADLARETAAANSAVPIFLAHGTADPLIPLTLARTSREALEARGYAVEWHTYPMQHEVCLAEIEDVRQFLSRAVECV